MAATNENRGVSLIRTLDLEVLRRPPARAPLLGWGACSAASTRERRANPRAIYAGSDGFRDGRRIADGPQTMGHKALSRCTQNGEEPFLQRSGIGSARSVSTESCGFSTRETESMRRSMDSII